MPIYEYHCTACGTDFEKLVFGPHPEVACSACGSKKTDKRMSRFGMGRSSGNGAPAASSSAGSGCGGCSSSSCAGCK
jgi:putative FmdB family regulatory protein